MKRIAVVLAVAVSAWFAAVAPAQAGDSPTVIEKVFGGLPGHPGFRVVFTTVGAMVQRVHLTDHRADDRNDDGTSDEYLLADIFWEDPQARTSYQAWLGLSEQRGAPDWLGADLYRATWTVAEDTPELIRFELDCGGGLTFAKTYAYTPDTRHLQLDLELRAAAEHPRAGQELALRLRGLGVRSPQSDYMFGSSVAIAAGETVAADGESEFAELRADGNRNTSPPEVLVTRQPGIEISFAGSTNRFFGAFLYPGDEASVAGLRNATLLKLPHVAQLDMPAYSIPVVEYGLALPVPANGETTRLALDYYLGPKSKRTFAAVPDYARLDHVVDNDLKPIGCFCEIPGVRAMARLLLWMLGILYDVVGNWGIAIMILTVIVRVCLVPLNFRTQKSMRAYGEKVRKLTPKLEEIKKRHANDKQALQQAMLAFQREHKMFPPVGGCLPMIITIPVPFGLFTALRASYDLRQQPFFGWIDDLSKPDQLFALGVPFVEFFNILPIIMVGLWLWLQMSTPLPNDPQQRQMMKIMRFMPLMFGLLLYNYASGLMVYMITSSMFLLVESRITKRILGPVNPDAAAFGAPPM